MNKFHSILLPSILLSLLLLAGCNSKPNDSTTKDLAMGYLKSNANISMDMIKVLKSFEREGAPVMTFQVGGMICDMPVLKTEQGWMARGLDCNGSIGNIGTAITTTPKDAMLKSLAKDVEKFNNQPHTPEDGALVNGLILRGDSLCYSITMVNVPTATDVDQTIKQQMREKLASTAKKDLCTDPVTRKMFDAGIDYVYNFNASDGSSIETVIVGKNNCI